MRVCDWISQYLASIGVERVHGLMGGGASGLNDGFIKQGMPYICYHHEQGAGHAAIGESKYTGRLAVVNPTTGCAGTNCATSVLNSWQDGVPVLFLSGNVRSSTCSRMINQRLGTNLRRYGIQEHDPIETYKSMTKMARFIADPKDVALVLEEAVYMAQEGRPGPVWIDIPGDVQTAQMPENPQHYIPYVNDMTWPNFDKVKQAIERSERPIVLAGYGIRQSGTVNQFASFINQFQIPYVSTYGARDYTPGNDPLNIGAVGIKGSRAGNFALQNADLLIVLGSSLNASVIGYDPKQFSPDSYKIVVDCDIDELRKDMIEFDETYHSELRGFFGAML